MSMVGLTKARRAMLEWYARPDAKRWEWPLWGAEDSRTRNALMNLGLLSLTFAVPTRGHAALAAPRMTQKQFALLIYVEGDSLVSDEHDARVWRSCQRNGWVEYIDEYDWGLTSSGFVALNNVRAAMGSPDWKEGL